MTRNKSGHNKAPWGIPLQEGRGLEKIFCILQLVIHLKVEIYPIINELGYCGQPSQTLFGCRLRQCLAKHSVYQGYLGWYVLSAQSNGWWRFYLKYQTVGRQCVD